MDFDMRAVGERIRDQRKAMNLTQERAAERIGISQRFYSQIERGEAGMAMNTMLALCDALMLTPDALLGYTAPKASDLLPDQLAAEIYSCTDDQQQSVLAMLRAFRR